MSTIPLKQQVRDLSKKLHQAINDQEIAHSELRKAESRHMQLQRSVNAYHIRLEALKMAGNCKYMMSSDPIHDIKSLAIQFEKWLLNGFEPVEVKDPVNSTNEEE